MPTNSKLAGKMPLMMGLMGAAGKTLAAGQAEATDFDGSTTDWLEKTSDLTGNSDPKTFTFSCFVYAAKDGNNVSGLLASSGQFVILLGSDGTSLGLRGYSSGEALPAFYADWPVNTLALETFHHLLISISVVGANTAKRHVYLNDVDITTDGNWNDGGSWFNDYPINTTSTDWNVAATSASSQSLKGRIAHLYLDYTYRDLSVEGNRRLFIDADLKPVTPPSGSILYLPMTDPDTVQVNSGTGGDFTLNGTVARSGRGPNQDNCVASEFDGSNDYLLLIPSAFSNSEFSTMAFTLRADTVGVNQYILQIMNQAAGETHLRISIDSSGVLYFYSRDVSAASNSYIATTPLVAGVNNHVVFQIDLSSGSIAADSKCYINGQQVTLTNTAFINANTIAYGDGSKPANRISVGGSNIGGSYTNGAIGEVFVDVTAVIPIESLWDSELGKPIPMINAIDNGLTPLVALPLIGSDAGNNLGSGGDFTVNSGPFTGARGASEFWARSAKFDGSTGYLSRGALTGSSDSKTFSIVLAWNSSYAGVQHLFQSYFDFAALFNVLLKADGSFTINAKDAGKNNVLSVTTTTNTLGDYHTLLMSVDLSNTSNRSIYIDGTDAANVWSTYVDTAINLTATDFRISSPVDSRYINGTMAIAYLTTDYIDFSQESNRLKFVDALGYPIDLTKQIEDGDIPEPLIYMKFEDTAALGSNSGTGGDFTVNGTVTAGSDVNP